MPRRLAAIALSALAFTLLTPAPAAASVTLSVTAYGAVGDGVHDDSGAFRAALAAAAGPGGRVVVPPGTYKILPSAFVTVPSGVSLVGEGATLVAGDYGFDLLWIAGNGISVSGLTIDGAGKVVRGITIDSGSTNVYLGSGTVENIAQPTDPSVSGFSANQFQVPAGVRIAGNGQRIVIDGLAVRHITATQFDSTWPHPTARGIWITPGSSESSSRDITVRNSFISDVAPKDDGDCLVAQGNPSDTADIGLQVIGNRFESCHKRAIKLQLPGVLVAGNSIDNPFLNNNFWTTYPAAQDNFDMYSAISVYASDIAVVGNVVGGAGSFYNGIDVDSGGNLQNIAIYGNSVSMGPASRIGAPSSLVGVLAPVSGLLIRDNVLQHATYGIRIDRTPSFSLISGNTITGVTTALYCPQGC